jgi:hypothetical protein
MTNTRFGFVTRHIVAGFALGACAVSPVAFAAGTAGASGADIGARYKADVERCNSGQTNQDRATCIREAGAALEEARRHRLVEHNVNFDQVKTARCQALPPVERDECMIQMSGQNTVVKGSVEGGGILRETTVVVPGEAAPAAESMPVVPLGDQPQPLNPSGLTPTTPVTPPAPRAPAVVPPPTLAPGTTVPSDTYVNPNPVNPQMPLRGTSPLNPVAPNVPASPNTGQPYGTGTR